MGQRALIVIDLQNDYFQGGAFPLHQAEATTERVVQAIGAARASGMPVVLVQHVADPASGPSPFFNEGTTGVVIHPAILEAAGPSPVVRKHQADAFLGTDLADHLEGVDELVLCGMMTQNCVTHTALSKHAEGLRVTVLADACTTVSEMLHLIALHALSARVGIHSVEDFVQ